MIYRLLPWEASRAESPPLVPAQARAQGHMLMGCSDQYGFPLAQE
jgi:hypothetical protein